MHLPTQRKLPSDAKEKAAKLLEMKANKKMVQFILGYVVRRLVIIIT